jgi:hypothetical protein
LVELGPNEEGADANILGYRAEAFGQEDKFVAGDVELFYRLSDDALRFTVGVDVG